MSQVKVFGVPSSAGCRIETSEVVDQFNGPQVIRDALSFMLEGFDIPVNFDDLGDICCGPSVSELLSAVEAKVLELRSAKQIPLILGGVHTLTLGTLRALKKSERGFSMIYFDAHPDCMPRADINYGSSLYHAVKEGVLDPKRLAFVGIRTIERPEWKFISDSSVLHYLPHDFEELGSKRIAEELLSKLPPPYFISLDLDSIDPVFAPGVSAPSPCGLQHREVLYLCREICKHPTVGAEIVELSPAGDANKQTARIAAMLLQSISDCLTAARAA